MDSYTAYPRSAPYAERMPLWDPSSVLEIENTSPGYRYITCAGYAPSQGRRCRISIRRENRELIEQTVNDIAYMSPDSPAVVSRLRAIASPALCVRFHQNQAEAVVQQWQRKTRQMKPWREQVYTEPAPSPAPAPAPAPAPGPRTQDIKTDQALKDALEALREMREYLAELEGRLRDRDGERNEERKTEHRQDEGDKFSEWERQRREDQERQAEREEDQRKENKRKEDEQKEKERQDEEERREREQREQERVQEEEREKRQREREQRKAQEEAARAERARLSREAAQKERTEWDRCWKQYQSRWKDFLANPATFEGQELRDVIPWPVRSGLYRDVRVSMVKEFLRTAPPREEGQDVNMAKLMRKECAKWHPDKVDTWLKRWRPGAARGTERNDDAQERVTAAERMVLEAISRATTDLLNEAAERSSELRD